MGPGRKEGSQYKCGKGGPEWGAGAQPWQKERGDGAEGRAEKPGGQAACAFCEQSAHMPPAHTPHRGLHILSRAGKLIHLPGTAGMYGRGQRTTNTWAACVAGMGAGVASVQVRHTRGHPSLGAPQDTLNSPLTTSAPAPCLSQSQIQPLPTQQHVTHSWKPCSMPVVARGISEWMTPRPAVIHCTPPDGKWWGCGKHVNKCT